MSRLISYWLKLYNKEDLGYFKYIVFVLLIILAFSVGYEQGIIFLFFGCAYNTYHITTMHDRNQVSHILLLSTYIKVKRDIALLFTGIIINIPFLIAQIVYIIYFFDVNLFINILLSLLIFIYGNILGIFIGRVIKKYLVGISFIIFILVICIATTPMFQELYLRYMSPILQLYNMKYIYVVNIVGILGFCVIMGLFCFVNISRRKKFCLFVSLTCMMFLGLVIYEKQQEDSVMKSEFQVTSKVNDREIYYKGISSDYAVYLGSLLLYMEEKLEKYDMVHNKWNDIYIIRTNYFPWESSTERIPFRIDESGNLIINCYTHSLLDMKPYDALRRIFNRTVNSNSIIQDRILSVLRSKIINDIFIEYENIDFLEYEIETINKDSIFLESNLFDNVKDRDDIVNYEWIFYTELVCNYPDLLVMVYQLGAEVGSNDFQALITLVQKSDVLQYEKRLQDLLEIISDKE